MRKTTCLLVAVLAFSITTAAQQTRWSEQKANDWYKQQPWLVGSNYVPATAINELEMWQADTFDPQRIDRELAWAESIGMNTMRVFLHDLLWQQDAEGFKQRLDQFLTIAAKHNIKPMFVLFDSVWDPNPQLGKQRAPTPGVHNSGWMQSPGAKALSDQSQYPRLEAYVKGVVGKFARDNRVLAWDIWNEPDNTNGGSYHEAEPKNKVELVMALLPRVFAWAREAGAQQPLTTGVWKGDWTNEKIGAMERLQLDLSDVISFHNYDSPTELEKRINWLLRFQRPLLCTEYMARGNGSFFIGSLPVFKRYNIAAINWGLVQGKAQTHLPWDSWERPYVNREPAIWFHEVFRTDGTPYIPEETEYIKRMTGKSKARASITVQVDKPGASIPSTLFGLFFEDINFGADGGLYPERIKNRSFEFPDPLMSWKKIEDASVGTIEILNQKPINENNEHYLRMERKSSGRQLGVTNEGFRGIGIDKGGAYVFSAYVRVDRSSPATLRVELEDEKGMKLGSARLSGFTSEWKKYSVPLRPTGTALKAHLNLFVEGNGALDVDMISLMPANTWRNRPNGLRQDLVQLLKDMKPGFLRFPGGCIVEGRYLATRYQWKTTIGDITDRKLIINRWNDEFKHRPAPDYYQSFGLGFYEYFLLSEDIGAEPLPIINCGMACQFNSNELAPLGELDPYIQDALDLIDFANSPVTTTWGKTRAALGHPAPFNLKMIGVGNEQWGPQYIERYKVFAKVLKEKHPEITLVTPAGPSPNDERFHFLWANLRALNADIVDEHYYMDPKWFRDNVNRYDDYPRTGPKVFAGEYAAQSAGVARPDNRNTWECALSEAAFMTGLVRNSDVVRMASYAPLFAHVDAWQWTPDLIWFDNLRSYGTPNYYVQKVFSLNKGTNILPVTIDGSTRNGQSDLFATASFDKPTGEVALIVVNTSAAAREIQLNLAGTKSLRPSGKTIVISNQDLNAVNSLTEPAKVAPVEKSIRIPSKDFSLTLAPNSVTVLRAGVTAK